MTQIRLLRVMLVFALGMILLGYGLTYNKGPYSFHKYREAYTLNIILNYALGEGTLLGPKAFQRGAGPGILGTEFTGVYWGLGRIIDPDGDYMIPLRTVSLLVYLVFVGGFYLFTRDWLRDRRARLCATIFLAANPMLLFYGLKVMPEIYYMAFGLIGYLCGRRAIRDQGVYWVLPASLFFAFGIMLKPFTVAWMFALFCELVFFRPFKVRMWLVGAVAVVPGFVGLFAWMKHAQTIKERWPEYNFVAVHYKFHRELEALTSSDFYLQLLAYASELYWTWAGFLILGFYFSRGRFGAQKVLDGKFVLWLGLLLLTFVLFCSAHIKSDHDYYGIFLLPMIAILLARLLMAARPSNPVIATLVGAYLIGSAVRIHHRFIVPTDDYRAFHRWSETYIPRDQHVVVEANFGGYHLNLLQRVGTRRLHGLSFEELVRLMRERSAWFVCPSQKAKCQRFLDHPSASDLLVYEEYDSPEVGVLKLKMPSTSKITPDQEFKL